MQESNKSLLKIFFVVGIVGVLTAQYRSGFTQVTTADLRGKISAEKDSPLENVNVIAENQETGVVRGAVSTKSGHYRVPALKPGIYNVTAQCIGFDVKIKRDIVLDLGQVAVINFELTSSVLTLGDTVIIVAKTPLIETTESDLGVTINRDEIRNLPLNSRNVLELALLSPGVNEARPVGGSAFSPINFGSLNSRATRVFLDGLNIGNDLLGGIFMGMAPQNAIEQFEVKSKRYKAEYGNSAGGIINLVTRSGTNTLHGSFFGLFRDEELQARNDFESVKPQYERQQFGLCLGGPVVRDKTHYFFSLERNRENAYRIVNTNGAFPQFEGSFLSPTRMTNLLVRVDHQLSADQWLVLKYSFTTEKRDDYYGGHIARSAGVRFVNKFNAISFFHKWVISSHLVSELRFGYLNSDITINTFDSGPHYKYPSVEFGKWLGGNQKLPEERWQMREDISYLSLNLLGEHDWKFGLNLEGVKVAGTRDLFSSGYFLFAADTSTMPFLGLIGDGNPHFGSIIDNKIAVYLQDDWSPSENMTLNLGLRYEIDMNATNQHYVSSKSDPDLPFVVKGDRPIDKNNIAPRLGFAWDPHKDGRMVIRGGYGVFFGQIPFDVVFGEQWSDRYRVYKVFGPGTTSKQEIELQGLPYQIDGLLPETVPTPYTKQISFGLSRQLTEDFALDMDFIASRGYNLIYPREDYNAVDPNTDVRPLPRYDEVYVARSDGKSIYNAVQIMLRKRPAGKYRFRAFYTLSKAKNDFDDIFVGSFPKTFKRGPAAWDERHRFTLDGQISLPLGIRFSGILILASGRPYSVFTGLDENGNGFPEDDYLPDKGRNSERAKGYADVDIQVSKQIKYNSYTIEVIGEVYNAFNRVNYVASSYGTFLNSSHFGQPTIALPGRQLQFGFRVSF